ncbi:MAG: ABC transporter substrate-binding protein [Eubacterium sp.]|nr:ABC transporter substrate-binding protein [Eubacterium sp.]
MNLKRHLLPLLFITALAICLLAGCGKNDTAKTSVIQKQGGKPLTKVTLNEVAHSIFYAPMYAAIENGYFEQEGIDLELVTGFGADKVMAAVLSGEADIGFMGPETTVYTYNEGASDAVVNFAQLTQRAGNFIVAREKTDAFQLSDLKGAEVLGGRAGGMPEMVFEYVLKKNGIKPSDVRIDQSIDFGSTAAAFSGGKGSYTVEFEPSATALEQAGEGFVVSSVGVESGYVPYTAFSAKKSYLDKNKDLIQSFTNALQKGMDYTVSHSSEEIAKTIQPQFSETDLDTLTAITERYHAQDTWKDDLVFSKESFELLLQILEDADVITKKPAYDTLVTTEFAEQAK